MNSKVQNRIKVKDRIRKKITGTSERPRLSVYRSLNNIYVQLIDDTESKTLLSVSSKSKDIAEQVKSVNKTEMSKIVGKAFADKAKEKNIDNVVFDRNGFRYHGRIKALADSIRENGIKL